MEIPAPLNMEIPATLKEKNKSLIGLKEKVL